MRNEIIYTDRGGRDYYRDDVKEDRQGYYLYDKWASKEIPVADEVMRPSRTRDNARGSARDNANYRPSPIEYEMPKEDVKQKEFKVEESYEDIRVFTPTNKVNSNKGLYNTLIESRDMDIGTHIVALYPSTEAKNYIEEMKKIKEYIDILTIKPSEAFEGEISEEADKFISALVNLSFKGIKMVEVTSNLKKLMSIVENTDPNWELLSSKLSKAIDGKVETNIYILPEEFEIIVSLAKGTDEFIIPDELKDKINTPFAGLVKINDIILSISYNKARLFMVLP